MVCLLFGFFPVGMGYIGPMWLDLSVGSVVRWWFHAQIGHMSLT